MKRKLLKTFLLAVGLLVGTSAWADPIETVNSSFAAGYRAAYSSAYTLASGKTLNLEFINYNNSTSTNYYNYILEATSAVNKHDGVYFDMRADNYAFGVGSYGKTYSGNYTSDLDGATVNFLVSYSSTTGIIEVSGTVTTTQHDVYPINYNYTIDGETKPDQVIIYLTEESAKLEIMKADIIDTPTSIIGLPFFSAFTNGNYPFDANGWLANNSTIGNVFTVQGPKNGSKTSTAYFDSNPSTEGNQPYAIGATETVKMSYDGYNGYYSYKMASTFSIVNSDGVVLASCTYNPNSQNYTDVTIAGSTVDGFEAFHGRSRNSTTKEVNGFNNQPYVLTSGYNPVVTFELSGNGDIKVSIVLGHASINKEFSVTGSSAKMDIASIQITNSMLENRDNNSERTPCFDNLLISSSTVAKTTYTVKFHDGEGNELQDDVEYETYVGNEFSAPAEDVAKVFYNNDASVKYADPTGNTPGTAVADAASNVITLVFTSYAKRNYTVQAVDKDNNETVLGTIEEGYVYADATKKAVNIPWYVLYNSTLYNKNANQINIDVENNNQVFNQEYTATEITNVVYYSEVEKMSGISRNISSTIASNRAFATFNNFTEFTTLPRGKYRFYTLEHCGNSSAATLEVKAGETLVASKAFPGSSNNQSYSSDEFSIYSSTTMTIKYPGGNSTGLDYIYIVKTADIPENVSATIGSTGWTTFSSNYSLDLSKMTPSSGTVTAYYASTVGANSVTLTSTDKSNLAAGQGIMLKGTAGATITIPVVASGEAISGNKLVGCPNETELGTNENYYVLVKKDESTPEFQSLASKDATIPAGKAYLNAGAAARSLQIVFDETTGGEAMHNAQCTMHNEMYDLQGRRVAQPKKGLYIKNGQKVYIK